MATQVTIENNTKLERLLMSSPQMEKKAIGIMRQLVRQARDEVAQKAEGVPKQDPRKTAHAIRSTVYRAVLGGNVNLLSSRKANAPGSYRPPRKLDANPHQLGGNRRKRSSETERYLGYVGFDRAFVLRWLDSGTGTRTTRYGNRGAIAARNWFQQAGTQAFNNAAQNLESLIDEIIQEELKA